MARAPHAPGRMFSIHAPREGSGVSVFARGCINVFSIHAPREGSGPPNVSPSPEPKSFSIHAPREGSGLAHGVNLIPHHHFLSTLPGRGAATATVPGGGR